MAFCKTWNSKDLQKDFLYQNLLNYKDSKKLINKLFFDYDHDTYNELNVRY